VAACSSGKLGTTQTDFNYDAPANDAGKADATTDDTITNADGGDQGGDDSAATVKSSGMVSGESFAAKSGYFQLHKGESKDEPKEAGAEEEADAGMKIHVAIGEIHIGDFADACGTAKSAKTRKNSKELVLMLSKVDHTPQKIVPGEYVANSGAIPGSSVAAHFAALDPDCDTKLTDEQSRAMDGRVVVEVATETRLKGRYNLTFAEGKLTGSFDITTCEGIDPQARHSCQ
jgi:hypothetical protein